MWLLTVSIGLAHKPSFGDDYNSPDSAFTITNTDISIVLYQELTCQHPEAWMTFEGKANEEVYIQLGVPVIDKFADYYPSVAILAPGLPITTDLPFDLPDGMGALVFDANEEHIDFYEAFTQTYSWLWVEERVVLPQDGQGYIVGWHPENISGKIWLAVGETEDFSDVESTDLIYWNEAVNNFHETGLFETPSSDDLKNCDDELQQEMGCSSLTKQEPLPFLFFLSALSFIRRQNTEI